MNFRKISALIPVFLLGIVVMASGYVPVKPDYADEEMWFNVKPDSADLGYDVFYVPATWEYDWKTSDSLIVHYADPSLPGHRDHMGIEMRKLAAILADSAGFYSPYYRHITLDTWATLDDQYIDSMYFAVSFEDIKDAFHHFIAEYSSGRPFFLAGFSQGGKSVVELMKTMPDSLWPRMIAAYVIGYRVTPGDTAICSNIRPARGSDDTGVTISYNSVLDTAFVKPWLSVPNIAAINPVNWRTDSVSAKLNDTVSVSLDPKYGVVVVKGYDARWLKPMLGIINTGDIHSLDPYLYREFLGDNVKARGRRYLWQNPRVSR